MYANRTQAPTLLFIRDPYFLAQRPLSPYNLPSSFRIGFVPPEVQGSLSGRPTTGVVQYNVRWPAHFAIPDQK